MNHSVDSGYRVGVHWLRAFSAEEKPMAFDREWSRPLHL